MKKIILCFFAVICFFSYSASINIKFEESSIGIIKNFEDLEYTIIAETSNPKMTFSVKIRPFANMILFTDDTDTIGNYKFEATQDTSSYGENDRKVYELKLKYNYKEIYKKDIVIEKTPRGVEIREGFI